MRVIITGATSFIGRAVAKELLTGSHHVFAVVRPDSPGLPRLETLAPGAEGKSGRKGGCLTFLSFTLGDIKELKSCPALVPSSASRSHSAPKGMAELWLHLGWEGAGSASRQGPHVQARNIRYTLDSLHTVARLGCARFLFCESQAKYGIVDDIMGEEILCHPVSEYGKGKLEVCCRVGKDAKTLGINYIHVRIFSVCSSGDHPWSLVSACLGTLLEEDRMEFGACTQQWNFLHMKDTARALTGLLLAKVPIGVCDVAGKDTRSFKSFVEQMYRLCGERGTCEYGKQPPNAERVVPLVPDIEELKGVAEFTQEISLEGGIREVIGIYKENCL